MNRGFDGTWNVAQAAPAIKKNGYDFVARYYGTEWKRLTLPESRAISAAGLYIVSVFELNPTSASYFTSTAGARDAEMAMDQASAAGQPLSTAIYFAVDYDAQLRDSVVILDYFDDVFATMKNRYEAAVYGNGLTCWDVSNHHKGIKTWLAMSRDWTGYSSWIARANIKQLRGTTLAGRSIDTDESNGDGGGWRIASPGA